MRKIIFFVGEPYLAWEHHRFGAEHFMQSGYTVEIWAKKGEYSAEYEKSGRLYFGDNYYTFDMFDIDEYRRSVEKNKNAIFVLTEIDYSWLSVLIEKKCCYYLEYDLACSFGLDIVAPSPRLENHIKKLQEKVLRALNRSPKENINLVQKRLAIHRYHKVNYQGKCKQTMQNCPPRAVFSATCHGVKERGKYYPDFIRLILKEKAIFLHSVDYDRFIEANREDPIVKEKFILFCDSGMTADFMPFNGKNEMPTRKHRFEYYLQLEKLFQKLEEHYQLPVMIAGHPRCYYTKDDFCGRKVVLGETCKLTRDAALVVFNTSTCISFPILYDKPIILTYNKWFKDEYYDVCAGCYRRIFSDIQFLADSLKIDCINLDDETAMIEPWKRCNRIESALREEFIKNYIIDSEYEEKTIAEYMEIIMNSMDDKN